MELNIMPFLPPAVPSSALRPSFLSLRKDRLYYTYNVTLRCFLATIAAVEKQ